MSLETVLESFVKAGWGEAQIVEVGAARWVWSRTDNMIATGDISVSKTAMRFTASTQAHRCFLNLSELHSIPTPETIAAFFSQVL